jgi:multiple sugar transport system permease protein
VTEKPAAGTPVPGAPAERSGSSSSSVRGDRARPLSARLEPYARVLFLWPAVVLLVCLSIFPLFVSLYLSLARLEFVPGGFALRWVGLANYRKLLFGIEQEHFLGLFAGGPTARAVALGISLIVLVVVVVGGLRRPDRPSARWLGRGGYALAAGALAWLLVRTLGPGGRPGTLVTTLLYVAVGVALQYGLGLGLALLCAQRLPGRRFFRVVFLLPMMITPVGIAYTFRILLDLGKGPLAPLWRAAGLAEVSWASDPWGARLAVLVGDVWQWTPLMFVVLLAALEGQPPELVEAAMVDGADRWRTFWQITWPLLAPVTATLVLIRLIEAFKIVDLPNVLTNGGPGTATESLTLQAFIAWRTLDIGGSAAVAYLMLLVVTVTVLAYLRVWRRRLADAT